MNGLAQLAALHGYEVSGSDRAFDPQLEPFRSLIHLGIQIFEQDGSGINKGTTQVVYSTAIEDDNPDLLKAGKRGIPLLHRTQFLKQLMGDAELIAVAGTAGKTTTTGILGWIFDQLGEDPNVYIGASVLNWKTPQSPGNVRKGASNLWIIEADESDRSFLNFQPTHSIITNISEDHYSLDELRNMFARFRGQTTGTVVEGTTMQPNAKQGGIFEFGDMEFAVPMLGHHNLENALCAIRLCAALGMDLTRVRNALATFRGIERRLEIAGQPNGITIIDDYAHNPAKISAALAAAAEYSHGQVHAYWRPHGFKPLEQGMDLLVDSFTRHWKANGGSIFILPVYYAGGSVERNVSADDLVERLNSTGISATLVSGYPVLKEKLEQCAQPGDVVLGMGARDPELPLFAKRLASEWKTE